MLHQKDESYKYVLPLKNWVGWISTRQEKKSTTSKTYILRKRAPKFKNLFFHFMTTFYNFALKIETRGAKRVVKSISETRYVNYIAMCLVHSSSDKKNEKAWKNNSTYAKFTTNN